MAANDDNHTIKRLEELGQSVWLDSFDRALLMTGELQRMVEEDGLRGVTSNPTIFKKAIVSTNAYDQIIESAPPIESDMGVLERIMVHDLATACDRLLPVYIATNRTDGFVSIEVNPMLAGDAAAQVEEASRLWSSVDRPNVMVKIPATRPGLIAIQSGIAHGININVTLLFSIARYREVIEAHLRGLERRLAANKPIDRISSVASFFVSRVDTKVDKRLDALPSNVQSLAKTLRGQIAIANAKIAYEEYEQVILSERWRALAKRGAQPQRLLWASTSPKDPHLPDTYYADALIGPSTVDTMTLETFHAYLDHGRPEPKLARSRDMAQWQMKQLAKLNIDFAHVTDELESEGVSSFAESFQDTLAAIAERRRYALTRMGAAAHV